MSVVMLEFRRSCYFARRAWDDLPLWLKVIVAPWLPLGPALWFVAAVIRARRHSKARQKGQP